MALGFAVVQAPAATDTTSAAIISSAKPSLSTNAAAPLFHGGLRAATDAAALDRSLVLLVFSATWCGPCQELRSKTLETPEFLKEAGLVHVADLDVDEQPTAARAYEVTAVPTLVLISPENKIVARTSGFLDVKALAAWIEQGRNRVKAGQWEGTAPAAKLDPFLAKAARGLDTNDLARLTLLLEDPDPSERAAVTRLLIRQRERAMPPLLAAVTNSYLGTRIAVSEALRELAPAAPTFDPWLAPSELDAVAADLWRWWQQAGRLPQAAEANAKPDPVRTESIQGAVDLLRGGEPLRRTQAMAALVNSGTAALPAIRQALKTSERNGDQRSVTLLEDVRWAILITDDLERRAPGTRAALARGTGGERQSAASRLGEFGPAALGALTELAGDTDPLVVESALRALAKAGGPTSLPAMSALLSAPDSNLRMTAAQALGHSGNPAAIPELVKVLRDSNEVVVCTALAAIEEVLAGPGHSSEQKPVPPEVIPALKPCLQDPRWRVRAAAAEMAGKVQAKDLLAEVSALLDDPDGFVVTRAFEARKALGGDVDAQAIAKVIRRLPNLRDEAVSWLVEAGGEEGAKALTELYQAGGVEARVGLLAALREANTQTTPEAWKPLLASAAAEPDAKVRRAVAETLASQPAVVCKALVGPLLADSDPAVRSAAAGVVLRVVSDRRVMVRSVHSRVFEQLVEEDDDETGMPNRGGKARIRKPPATSAELAAWHDALKKANPEPDLRATVAIFVTGTTNAELPLLAAAVAKADNATLNQAAASAMLPALLPRLTWPEARPIFDRFCSPPSLYLRLLSSLPSLPAGARDYLTDPARFRAAVEGASTTDLEPIANTILASQGGQWSLLSGTPQTQAILAGLLESTNPLWRAAAVYALTQAPEGADSSLLARAARDSNAWVRAVAASGFAGAAKDRLVLERYLVPLLDDPDQTVARKAAAALLEPSVRSAAGLEFELSGFQFGGLRAWATTYGGGSQSPHRPVRANPAVTAAARKRLEAAKPGEAPIWTLLLAQYGDPAGLDRLLASSTAAPADDESQKLILMMAIGLTGQPRFLPLLEKMLAAGHQENSLPQYLQAARSMSGPEVRQFRVEVNRRLRQLGGDSNEGMVIE